MQNMKIMQNNNVQWPAEDTLIDLLKIVVWNIIYAVEMHQYFVSIVFRLSASVFPHQHISGYSLTHINQSYIFPDNDTTYQVSC